MRRVTTFLYYVSRIVSICALLATLGLGLMIATLGVAFTCFDSCPAPQDYVPNMTIGAINMAVLCAEIELVPLVCFLAYCGVSRQMRRFVRSVIFLVVGGAVGAGVLWAFLTYLQGHVPVTPDGYLDERLAEEWKQWFGLCFTLVVGVWSGVFAYMQGPRPPRTPTAAQPTA